MHQLMTLSHFFYFYIFIFFKFLNFPLLSLFWMLIDTMFTRDMYHVYEVNDDWLMWNHISQIVCSLSDMVIVSYRSAKYQCGVSQGSHAWAAAICCIHLFHVQRCTAVQCWPPPICRRHSNVRCTISNWYQHKCFQPCCTPIIQSESLVINPDKSEAVFFSTALRSRKSQTAIKQVDVASCPVLISNSVKIISSTLDQHLTFNDHVQNVWTSAQYHT